MEPDDKQIVKKNPPHRFQPGQSGNPKGRPKSGKAISDLVRAELAGNKGKALARVLVREALAGNMVALGMVLDRVEGKCPQIIEAPGGGVSLVLAMVAEMDRVTAPGPENDQVQMVLLAKAGLRYDKHGRLIEAKPDGE